MPTMSDNTKGNPYHDDEGKFTTANGKGGSSEEVKALRMLGVRDNVGSSRDIVPNKTKNGLIRIFARDMSEEEKDNFIRDYIERYKEGFKQINELAKHQTSKINTEARRKWRINTVKDVVYSQENDSPKSYDRKMTVVIGLAGSGKSTISNKILEEQNSFLIDPDIFKNLTPEFQRNPYAVSQVHEESKMMSEMMLKQVMEKGGNICYGKVGYPELVDELEKLCKDNDYELEFVYNDLPLFECINRAMIRYESGKSKRLLNPANAFRDEDQILDMVDLIISRGHKLRIYSNDVDIGEEPKLIKEF